MATPSALLFQLATERGMTARTHREEIAIRVRILDGKHLEDGLRMLVDELGDRSKEIGRIYIARNPLAKRVNIRAKAYSIPPLVSGLSQELAFAIGDYSAKTTIERYAGKVPSTPPDRPFPTKIQKVALKDLRYRIATNRGIRVLGWASSSQRPIIFTETPDLYEAEYTSDDPDIPTIIRWVREWTDLEGRTIEVQHVSDLRDLSAPSYTVQTSSGDDVTELVLGKGWEWPYYFRYAPDEEYPEGRPFHRFILSGDPRDVYSGTEAVDATLRAISGRTQWWATIRDACFAQRNVEGMELQGMASSSSTGQTGIAVGAETVLSWGRVRPDVAGSHWVDQNPYDPDLISRALRGEENSVLTDLDIDVDFEKTGGEPTATQAAKIEEAILSTLPDCRAADALTLRRIAAMANRVGDNLERQGKTRPIKTQPENGYSCLYRQEVEEELKRRDDADGNRNEGSGTGEEVEGAGEPEGEAPKT